MKKKFFNLMSRGLIVVAALSTLSLASCERDSKEKPDEPDVKKEGVEILLDDSMVRGLPGEAGYNVTAKGGGGDIEITGLGHYEPNVKTAILKYRVKQGYALNYAGRKDGSRSAKRQVYDKVVGANFEYGEQYMDASGKMIIKLDDLPDEVTKIYVSADYRRIADDFAVWPMFPNMKEIGMPEAKKTFYLGDRQEDLMDFYALQLNLKDTSSPMLGTGIPLYKYIDHQYLGSQGFYSIQNYTGDIDKDRIKLDTSYNDLLEELQWWDDNKLAFTIGYPPLEVVERGLNISAFGLGHNDNFVTRAIYHVYQHYNIEMLKAARGYKGSGIPTRYNPAYWPYLYTQVDVVKQMDADLQKIISGLKYVLPISSPRMLPGSPKIKLLDKHPQKYDLNAMSLTYATPDFYKKLLYARKYNFELNKIKKALAGWSFLKGGYEVWPIPKTGPVTNPLWDEKYSDDVIAEEEIPFSDLPTFIISTNSAITREFTNTMRWAAKEAPYLLTKRELAVYGR